MDSINQYPRAAVVGLYQTLHEKYESITQTRKTEINGPEKENDDIVKPSKGVGEDIQFYASGVVLKKKKKKKKTYCKT